MNEVANPLADDLTIPAWHPLAGRRAWACATCSGIFYPENEPPEECPYCNEEDSE